MAWMMLRSHRPGSGSPCRGLCSTTPFLALTSLPPNLRNHRRNCTDRPVAPWAEELATEWLHSLELVAAWGSLGGGCGSTTLSWRRTRCSQDQLRSWEAAVWL